MARKRPSYIGTYAGAGYRRGARLWSQQPVPVGYEHGECSEADHQINANRIEENASVMAASSARPHKIRLLKSKAKSVRRRARPWGGGGGGGGVTACARFSNAGGGGVY